VVRGPAELLQKYLDSVWEMLQEHKDRPVDLKKDTACYCKHIKAAEGNARRWHKSTEKAQDN
jgi:hypothetical protein